MAETALKAKLKLLQARKEALFSRIQQLYDKSRDVTTQARARVFTINCATLNETKSNFEKTVEEIIAVNLQLDADYVPNFQEINAVNDIYCEILNVKATLNEANTSGVTSNENHKPTLEAFPRLPKIDLREFDGDPINWPLFYQTFKSLIHNNPKLDNVTKIHYLLGQLKGKALSTAAGILPTAENYSIVWSALINKYEDKRALATMYLSRILEFKQIQQERVGGLNSFIEKVDSAIHALGQLDIENLGDFILATVAVSKLDTQTQRLFERSLTKDTIPSYKQVGDFVKEQAKVLARTTDGAHKLSHSTGSNKSKVVHSFTTKQNDKNLKYQSIKQQCIMCTSKQHRINKCTKFLNLAIADKIKFVNDKSLCFNCLSSNHVVSNCTSSGVCSRFLLATAKVYVLALSGERYEMRVLVDTASQCNFITYKCLQRLKLPLTKTNVSVSGIGVSYKKVWGQTQLAFLSKYDLNTMYPMAALVIDKITDKLPTCEIDAKVYKHFNNLKLADETFHLPGEIDGVIGAELVPLLLTGTKYTVSNLPTAINSNLGFIIMGKAQTSTPSTELQSFCCIDSDQSNQTIENLLKKFWEIEEIANISSLSSDDLIYEDMFAASLKRDNDGRYIAALPFKNFPPNLGDSYKMALHRFENLERRFKTAPFYQESYSLVIQDYINQGHMNLVKEFNSDSLNYFIPHHGIFKASESTPLRVVFDASARSETGLSLNDVLYTGPKLQADIFTMLINFRLFQFTLVADVRQMYRQIKLCSKHWPYQRLLWRFSSEDPLQIWELTTVSFGIKSSPYMALRVIKQLAMDEMKNFPLAAQVALRDIYMDDVISSIDDLEMAKTLYHQLVGLFRAGGFELVKWASNSPALLDIIPIEIQQKSVVDFDQEYSKVLGLQWQMVCDTMTFSVNLNKIKCTKRSILSTVALIWDPLGILSPISVYAKLLIKELWLFKLDWDDPIPPITEKMWLDFQNELHLLSDFKLNRWIGVSQQTPVTLLGFSDASEKAYAAVVYIRVRTPNGRFRVTLLCAKSKVAPIKTLSIPRLELCSALLLAKLLHFVKDTYSQRCTIENIYAFSDSTVVLNWINDSPHRWKTFVANRVSKIQDLINTSDWFHISGKENPADCASRGMLPRSFLEHSLWFTGPSWCQLDRESWPTKPFIRDNSSTNEEKLITLPVTQIEEDPLYAVISRVSSWSRLLNIFIYILRFCKILPMREYKHVTDLMKAEVVLLKIIQKVHFSQEINLLENRRLCSPKFRHLCPFLKDGLIRVGDRLRNANLSYDHQHPILLPKKEHLTELLIDQYHRVNLHAGSHLVHSLLRQKYWILAARGLIRYKIKKCNLCFKTKPRPVYPLMADLPSSRVTQAKPFLHTGVDYAGPLWITMGRKRGIKSQKAYICLFVCMTTRAIHLELASDLSTEVFLAAFKRFISRRGPCSIIYSDCGTNFVGAHRLLNSLEELVQSKGYIENVNDELIKRHIEWKFNPPTGSHFGGSWERMVRSVKNQLSKTIGEQILSYEELNTVLVQIEALLNSRPLCWLSSDPSEASVLTPAHFLTLTPLQYLPAEDETNKPINRLSRKQLVDQIVQSYWKRWHLEYLSSLQSRQKWNTPQFPIRSGMLVIIIHDNLPPLQWPIGVVEEIFPAKDGIVRVATVRTKGGVYKRPVVKLCPLPSQ